MGFECTYEIPHSAANLIISREYDREQSHSHRLSCRTLSNYCSIISTLESRLRVLEQLAASRFNEASATNAMDLSPMSSSSIESDIDVENDRSHNQGALIVNVQLAASGEQAETDDTDGMAVSLVDDNDPGYFGKHLVNKINPSDC